MRWTVRTRRLIKALPALWRNGRVYSAAHARVRSARLLLERQIRYSDHPLLPLRKFD